MIPWPQGRKATSPAVRAGPPSSAGTWAGGALLAAGTIAVYSRTFSSPLLLDDAPSIEQNLSLRHLWPLGPVLSPPNYAGVGGRPLLNFSYALNYAAGGTGVFGYHLINLLIHVLAAWTLFALVRGTLRRPVMAGRFASSATLLALAIAAIWAWHPLQTASVTYVSQRAESLMGLFYLLTLYGFSRYAADAGKVNGWAVLSVLACLAGVVTKEVIATAPLLAFLYDRTFISGSFSAAWRRHRAVYLALAATWLPLGLLMIGLHHRGVGFRPDVVLWSYGLTECRAVVKYLLLAFWPHPLVFDYGNYEPSPLSELWLYGMVVVALLGGTVVALRRWPVAAFAGCWFFLILAPASSLVPIVGQPMAENRVYLSLAAVVAFVVLGVFARTGRGCLPVFTVAAVVLALVAGRRNQDYASEEAIWSDTVAKAPENSRARENLGEVWLKVPGRSADAISQFQEAIRLRPGFSEAHYNLGNLWLRMPGRLDDAIAQYQEAVRLDPDFIEAHNNLGNAWLKVPGRLEDAIAQFETALRLRPDHPEAHYNLGNAWARMPGRLNDAIAQYRETLRLRPDVAEVHFKLAAALLRLPDHRDEAKAELEAGLRLEPGNETARRMLARTVAGPP